jgi:hypothetical protein
MQRVAMSDIAYRRIKGAPQLRAVLNLIWRRGDASAVIRKFRNSVQQAKARLTTRGN